MHKEKVQVCSKLCSTLSPGDTTVGDFNFLNCDSFFFFFCKEQVFCIQKHIRTYFKEKVLRLMSMGLSILK